MFGKTYKLIMTLSIVVALLAMVVPTVQAAEPQDYPLWDLLVSLKELEFVDLTHAFEPGIPRWSGFPSMEITVLYDFEADGFFAQEFCHVGQYGTHFDPPAHFAPGLRYVDDIELEELILPLVVIDVSAEVAEDPDYQLTVADIKAWEKEYGPIPAGAFVAMRTDWSKRFPDVDKFANKDEEGQAHYPGWSLEALQFLYEERHITANGHEPPDTDAAVQQLETGFAGEFYILESNHYQIELLNNLDKVPAYGAIVFVGVPKVMDGSGFPARLFAIVPPEGESLWELATGLGLMDLVDMSHPFSRDIPRWSGFDTMVVNNLYNYLEHGFQADEYCHVGQYGTHLDPPVHFSQGKRAVDDIPVEEFLLPLVVIDVMEKVIEDPNYQLTVADIEAWEEEHGPIPAGAFVAMRTGWSKRWPDVGLFANKDEEGQAHYPGWSLEALQFLYEERHITANGHEPPDTDAAIQQLETGFAGEFYVLDSDHYQIELLDNLEKIPEAGALVWLGVPKIKDGSGFPARVVAISIPQGIELD